MDDDEKARRVKKGRETLNAQAPKVELWHVRDHIEGLLIDTFPDETGEAWAYYHDGERKRFDAIEGERFRDFVRVIINDLVRMPREAWLDPVVKLLASKARRFPKRRLYLRQARQGAALYYQISEERAVKVTADHSEEIDCPPLFRTFTHQEPLRVELTATATDLDLLDRYLPFAGREERELFKTTLCAYFIPGISKPMQLFRGPPGSAKSTASRLLKQLIDPSASMRMGIPFPKTDGDWQVNGRQHLVVFLDNLGFLKKEEQDECCRVVTGKSVEKRKLYTDNDTVADEIRAILVINAIDLTHLNSDFLDRAFIWELTAIPEQHRIPEEDFVARLQADLPRIRGAIFQVVRAALREVETVIAPELRLKDFSRWAAACAAARGIGPEEFAAQVKIKTELQRDESIAQSQLTGPLVGFMSDKNFWEGQAKDLLRLLTEQEYGSIEGDQSHERLVVRNVPKSWFSEPSALGKELAKISHLLERLDLRYTNGKGTKGVRTIRFDKISKVSASPATQQYISSMGPGGRKENLPATHLPPATQEAEKEAGVAEGGGKSSNSCHPGFSSTKTAGWQERQEKRPETLSIAVIEEDLADE